MTGLLVRDHPEYGVDTTSFAIPREEYASLYQAAGGAGNWGRSSKEIVEKEAVLRYYSRGKSNWRDTIMAAAPQGQVSTAEQLPSSYRSLGLLSSPYTSRIDR